jgi:VIT1/CCC1 family predicted Fe2+/Mn2+ transporter
MSPTSPSTTPDQAAGLAARALRLVTTTQKRVLDPVERFSEIIFGLIMVLTFTGSISVAESGRQEIRDVLAAALACNVAWGIIDGVMYVVTSLVARARAFTVLVGLRVADRATAHAIVRGALPEGVAAVTDESDVERMVNHARALPAPHPVRIRTDDLKGALASCLLVVAATLPPTVPFAFIEDAQRALRVSNGVAVASLFVAGYYLGKATGVRGWLLGLAMVVLGAALVALTIALGG